MTAITKKRVVSRIARKSRIRKRLSGTAERPRLCVRRSLKNMVVQIIDDVAGKSLVQVSSMSGSFQKENGSANKTSQSSVLGKLVAEKAIELGIKTVVFDRGGYIYHGRVKACADAARKSGLEF